MNFKDKVVLITGAGSGIGKATALLYAEKGAKIICADINEENGLAVKNQIKENGGTAIFHKVNVAEPESVNSLFLDTTKQFGRLDIAVNNAGIGAPMAPTHAVQDKDWDRVIAVNQSGVFYGMRAALNIMIKQGSGNIVNISSIAGLRGFQGQLAYCASKHAVVGMTKTAALEYAKQNIRINAVCPVFTISPLVEQLFSVKENMKEKLLKTIPMGRFGDVRDIANTICWISSEEASFMTGMAINVDGGQMS